MACNQFGILLCVWLEADVIMWEKCNCRGRLPLSIVSPGKRSPHVDSGMTATRLARPLATWFGPSGRTCNWKISSWRRHFQIFLCSVIIRTENSRWLLNRPFQRRSQISCPLSWENKNINWFDPPCLVYSCLWLTFPPNIHCTTRPDFAMSFYHLYYSYSIFL